MIRTQVRVWNERNHDSCCLIGGGEIRSSFLTAQYVQCQKNYGLCDLQTEAFLPYRLTQTRISILAPPSLPSRRPVLSEITAPSPARSDH